MIVGRKQEINAFNDALQKSSASFIAVWGRRRVGKTFLVRNFFADKGQVFELVGQKDADASVQLHNFNLAFSSAYLQNSASAIPKSWNEAFAVLTNQLLKSDKRTKQIIFFDELPWLGQPCLDALDHAWNAHWSKFQNVILIVCGSSASWMMRKVINAKGGLYNRLTTSIHLQPFDLAETKLFLETRKIAYPIFQLVELYLATGGVPQYLDQLKRGLSVAQNIDQLMFRDGAPLKLEYPQLFDALFENSKFHYAIMKFLSKSRQGVMRKMIKTDLKMADGTLQDTLEDLEASGFIKTYTPFGYKKRESFCRITDEYSLFYLKWIDPIKNKKTSPHYWTAVQSSPAWNAWAGYGFEWFCEKHSAQILKALGISGISSTISKWKCQANPDKGLIGGEVDLVIDRADQIINICELKFTRKPFIVDKKFIQNQKSRISTFEAVTKTRKACVPILISANGAPDNVYLKEAFYKVLTLDELFEMN